MSSCAIQWAVLVQKHFLDEVFPAAQENIGYVFLVLNCASKGALCVVSPVFQDPLEVVQELCATTGGHPFYTQHLCHAVWELCEGGSEATSDTIAEAIGLLLERESYAYTALWESFAVNQRRFLSGLVQAERGVEVFGSSFIKKNNLKSASSAQRVVVNLLERDIIDREDGSYFIADRFFHLWVISRVG